MDLLIEHFLQCTEKKELHIFSTIERRRDEVVLASSTHMNTQGLHFASTFLKHKTVKEHPSVLVCAKADGSHRFWPVVVRRSARPRILKGITKIYVLGHVGPLQTCLLRVSWWSNSTKVLTLYCEKYLAAF